MGRPGRRPGEQTKVETKLARKRVERGMTQEEVADAAGIRLSTYWKLERGRMENPGVRYFVNCAVVLGCKVEDLLDDELLEWWRPHLVWSPHRPESPKKLWRKTGQA
jgi:transcriptional regulator with XRE-family HTH domain